MTWKHASLAPLRRWRNARPPLPPQPQRWGTDMAIERGQAGVAQPTSDMLWYTNVAVPAAQCRHGLPHLSVVVSSKRAQHGTPQVEQARAAVEEREGSIAARAEAVDREAAQAQRATQADREAVQALQAEFRCGCAVPVSISNLCAHNAVSASDRARCLCVSVPVGSAVDQQRMCMPGLQSGPRPPAVLFPPPISLFPPPISLFLPPALFTHTSWHCAVDVLQGGAGAAAGGAGREGQPPGGAAGGPGAATERT